MFDINNTDTLSNLFGNLTFDIQENIYNEVLVLQETEKTKERYKLVMNNLIEIMCVYECFDYKQELNSVYEYLDCGKRVDSECSNGCVSVIYQYDELYYDNLDYLLMCDIDTEINVEVDNIGFNYKLKENYTFLRKYYDRLYNDIDYDIDCDFQFHYNLTSMNYNLYDFCECDILDTENSYELEELLEDNLENTDNETLKTLLYLITNRKIFYGKEEKYDNIMLF